MSILGTDEGVYPPIVWVDPQGSIAEIQRIKNEINKKERVCGGAGVSPKRLRSEG